MPLIHSSAGRMGNWRGLGSPRIEIQCNKDADEYFRCLFLSGFQLAYTLQNLQARSHTTQDYQHYILIFINLRKTFRSKSFRIYGNVEPIEMHIDFDENQINKLDTDNNAQFYYC